jgi:hypothetical protein
MTGVLLEIPCTHHRCTFSLGAPLDRGFQKLRIRIVNHEIDACAAAKTSFAIMLMFCCHQHFVPMTNRNILQGYTSSAVNPTIAAQ